MDGNIYVSKRFPAKTFLVNVGSEWTEYLLERKGVQGLASSRDREQRDTIVTPRLSVFCNIFILPANCLLPLKNITLLMRVHNPLLRLTTAAVDSRRIAKERGWALLLLLPYSHSWHTKDAVPIVLIRPGSFTFNTPPNMLITTANIKATLVKVWLHTFNVLLRNPFLDTSECFFCAHCFLATGLFTMTSLWFWQLVDPGHLNFKSSSSFLAFKGFRVCILFAYWGTWTNWFNSELLRSVLSRMTTAIRYALATRGACCEREGEARLVCLFAPTNSRLMSYWHTSFLA